MSKTLVTTFALGLAASVAQAEPVTMETLVDRAELIRIADSLDAAVDAKDWSLARSFFTDTIRVDFSSLTGAPAASIPADALIDGWSANLAPSKTSFHLRGNHRISFEGEDAAVMQSHGYAWNRLEEGALPENGGEALWEVWGVYTHSFARMDGGWRLTGMVFEATAERGNPFVRNTPGS